MRNFYRLLSNSSQNSGRLMLEMAISWSGRWDSNPRLFAWEANTLPLSYARQPCSAIITGIPSQGVGACLSRSHPGSPTPSLADPHNPPTIKSCTRQPQPAGARLFPQEDESAPIPRYWGYGRRPTVRPNLTSHRAFASITLSVRCSWQTVFLCRLRYNCPVSRMGQPKQEVTLNWLS